MTEWWTDAKKQALRELHAEKLPYRVIAERLGVNKNAVSGQAHRLGLPSRKPEGARLAITERRKPRLKTSHSGAIVARRVRMTARKKAMAAPPPPIEAPPTAVTLFDLERHHCRWPYDTPEGTVFCGAHADTTYCPSHHAVAHTRIER